MTTRHLVGAAVSLAGLRPWMEREFFAVRMVENLVVLPQLPAAFDGFRLLQISDPHIDLDPRLVDVICGLLASASFDLAVCTGDYLNDVADPWQSAVNGMKPIIAHMGDRPLGILGNHDLIAMTGPLEAAGLRILLNESVRVDRGGASLWFCGVDDAHVFRTHDLRAARRDVPGDECAILLSHSPETWRDAAELGYALHLSGHTHGGQICLPGGIAIRSNCAVPRRLIAGAWREGAMVGYTSRGTGGCAVAARMFCPPEITIHTLRCAG